MVRHGVQIVQVRRPLTLTHGYTMHRHAWRERRGHVVGQVELVKGKIHARLDLVRRRATEREALQVDQQHGRQTRETESLGGAARPLALGAVPRIALVQHLFVHERVHALVQRGLRHTTPTRHRQRQRHERVVRDGHVPTREACQLVAKLPLERVHNHTVISPAVQTPFRHTRELLWQPTQLRLLRLAQLKGRWPLHNAVQVLVQPIEQKQQKLLAVLLLVAAESRGKLPNRLPERRRRHCHRLLRPQRPQQRCQRMRQGATCPKWILRVDGFLVGPIQHVLRQQHRRAETLDRRIHVACLPKVAQTRQTNADIARHRKARRCHAMTPRHDARPRHKRRRHGRAGRRRWRRPTHARRRQTRNVRIRKLAARHRHLVCSRRDTGRHERCASCAGCSW